MRALFVIAFIGFVAQQTFADAAVPKATYAAPAQEYGTPEAEQPTGYSVQSGYEGYLVPAESEVAVEEEESEGGLTGFISQMLEGGPIDAITALLGQAGLDNIVNDNKITLVGAHGKPVVIPLPFGKPKHGGKDKGKKHLKKVKKVLLAKILAKFLVNVIGFTLLFLAVAGVGAVVCAFTPLCAISFPVGRSMKALATVSNLNTLSNFVMQAVDKYQMMQG